MAAFQINETESSAVPVEIVIYRKHRINYSGLCSLVATEQMQFLCSSSLASGKMILLTKKKITMDTPPLSTVAPIAGENGVVGFQFRLKNIREAEGTRAILLKPDG